MASWAFVLPTNPAAHMLGGEGCKPPPDAARCSPFAGHRPWGLGLCSAMRLTLRRLSLLQPRAGKGGAGCSTQHPEQQAAGWCLTAGLGGVGGLHTISWQLPGRMFYRPRPQESLFCAEDMQGMRNPQIRSQLLCQRWPRRDLETQGMLAA